jgi:type II secretory pathway component PulK
VKKLIDMLKGIDVPPVVVGIARGAVEAAVLAALAVVGMNMDAIVAVLPELPVDVSDVTLAAGGWWLVRALEAWADQRIDPAQNRTRTGTGNAEGTAPPSVFGPVDPAH